MCPKVEGCKLRLLFLSLFFVVFIANSETCCVCETQVKPILEEPLYSIGCNMWLSQQKDCGEKVKRKYSGVKYTKDRLHSPSYFNHFQIPQECVGADKIRLAFVGHWSSSQESAEKLLRNIIPTAKEKRIDFEIENTACSSMDQPELFRSLIHKFDIPKNIKITYKGHQAVSVGLWNKPLPALDSYNIHATWDSHTNEVSYPNCKPYINKSCEIDAPTKAVLCSQNEALYFLSCEKKTLFTGRSHSSGPAKSSSYRWTQVRDSERWKKIVEYRKKEFDKDLRYLATVSAN